MILEKKGPRYKPFPSQDVFVVMLQIQNAL
jgi:hypothetical protein